MTQSQNGISSLFSSQSSGHNYFLLNCLPVDGRVEPLVLLEHHIHVLEEDEGGLVLEAIV